MSNGKIPLNADDLVKYGLDKTTARKIFQITENIPDPEECWEKLTREQLHPDMPYEVHQILFQYLYDQDDQFTDAPQAWRPDAQTIDNSNIAGMLNETGHNDFESLRKWSVSQRLEFWKYMIRKLNIRFQQPYDQKVAEFPEGLEKPHWLPGASFNIAESCFQASPGEVAIIYQSENGPVQKISYSTLENQVNRVANGLKESGFQKGNPIAVDMPMTAESVILYLGIVKYGCPVVSIADSLAPAEVDKRLKIAGAKAIFTQDIIPRGGKSIPLYNKLREIDLPKAIVLPGHQKVEGSLRDQDITWNAFLSDNTHFDANLCEAEDPCNILFSSGTTGEPKAIPWTHTTPVKCAADGFIHHDIKPGEVVSWPTNLGWMMGPWLIFAALINKAAIGLYYGAPTGRGFGEFVRDAKVNMLGLVPSMVKRWIETGCMKGLDWSSIKLFSSTGESSNPKDYLWLMARAGYRPVIEYCGGTEIGGGYATGTIVQPASPATFSTPALGLDLMIINEEGKPAQSGEIFIIPPSIGFSNSLLNKDHSKEYYRDTPEVPENATGTTGIPIKAQQASFPGSPLLRRHGDEMEQLNNGYLRAHGRADDTMNLGGIKTSSVEIERLLDLVDGVNETAAIAVQPSGSGPSQLVVYAVAQENNTKNIKDLKSEFQKMIKKQLNPLFKVHDVVLVDQLPRTASNKIMRRVLRNRYSG